MKKFMFITYGENDKGEKINNMLINKNEILAIIPYETKTKKITKYVIDVHVKTYNQFSKTYTATYDNEMQWKVAFKSIIEELENE